ncbi:hypothetical protein BAUCODRAFT_41203, partial [Baudoinia panamericana UAMH 10762]
SGVQWRYCRLGLAMLDECEREHCSLTQDAEFNRKLYLDSIGYLLRGLPLDLTEHETAMLRAAFHASVKSVSAISAPDHDSAVSGCRLRDPHGPSPAQSVLQKAVAGSVLFAFFAIDFLLPYAQSLAQGAYCWERRYKLSDRLFAHSMVTAEVVWKLMIVLIGSVCTMQAGEVGRILKAVAIWWVEGLTAGLQEGVMEGMQLMGARA